MRRRVYLASAAAVALAGCSALTESESADEDEGTDGGGGTDGSPEPVDADPGSFDEFEDLSQWTVMEGTLVADDERVYAGSQSARMEADESDERTMIKREFETPRDLSETFPALAFASDLNVNPTVQLTDTDGDRLLLRCAVAADGPFVRRDLGFEGVDGDPDLGSIEHTKISVWAGEREPSLWCDDYHFVDRPATGTVLLQFPEATDPLLSNAASVLEAYDVPATAFVPTERVGGPEYPSVEDLESLHDDGWTIASAGTTGTDLTAFDADEQEARIASAAAWLEDHGFDDAFFSYPLDRYDERTVALVEEYHDLGFVGGYAGHGHLTNPHLAPRAVDPDADEAERLLQWTAEYGAITTLAYRGGEDASLESFDSTVETLAGRESEGDLEVVTPAELASNHLHE